MRVRDFSGMCVLWCGLVAWPTVVAAQPSTGTVFISGSALAAIEASPTYDRMTGVGDGLDGTVAGGSLAIGVHLTERVSARFEWSLTDSLKNSQAFPGFTLGLSSEPTLTGSGFTFGSGLATTSFPSGQSIESKRSTAAGFSLLGYHLGRGRTSLELVGGLGLLRQTVRTRYRSVFRGLPGTSLPFPDVDSKGSTYAAVAVVGADAAVGLTDHAAIVPHVRVYALNGGLSIRPGLGLRWTF